MIQAVTGSVNIGYPGNHDIRVPEEIHLNNYDSASVADRIIKSNLGTSISWTFIPIPITIAG